MGYVKVPNGMGFSTKFKTFIIAFCPDSDSWFVTNKRFFYYEYPMCFSTEDLGIRYFENNAKKFYDLEIKMGVYKPSCFAGAVFLENTKNTIIVDKEKYNDNNRWRSKIDCT